VVTADPVVCIVGAGPAGLAVAHLLRQAGISAVVLERQEPDKLRTRVKAGMIEHRTVELLKAHELADPILKGGVQVGMCEFRADGEAFMLDYAARCDGRCHTIFPQHELVAHWADQLIGDGGDLRFGVNATAIEQDEDGVVVRAVAQTEEEVAITCETAVCCDGAASAFTAGVESISLSHPFRWLALIAAAAPSTRGTIYGLHRRGFAGQMHRSPSLTRFMLEVPVGEGYDKWPDDRIWEEIETRLAAEGRPPILRGEFVERDVLDHRVRVCTPMQDGRVFFAGDAAHLITPAGGKGMNIALQDAVELAAGLVDRFCNHDDRRLARYSETRLPNVWRHQEFSNLMLTLFSSGARDEAGAGFSYSLRRARLDLLVNDQQFSRWFAHAYAGVDDWSSASTADSYDRRPSSL
jgi:p-hydroxybenzoate 3-monooxygenase